MVTRKLGIISKGVDMHFAYDGLLFKRAPDVTLFLSESHALLRLIVNKFRPQTIRH